MTAGAAASMPYVADRMRRAFLIAERRRKLEQLLAQPYWSILLQQAGVLLCYGVVLAAEYPLMRTALDTFVVGVEVPALRLMAICVLIGYAMIWHAVGDRLERAEDVRLSIDPPRRRSFGPGIGVLGWLYVVVGLGTAGAVAYLRADEMATQAAAQVVREARLAAGGTIDAAALDVLREQTLGEKLITEIVANVALMGMMALVAVLLARPRRLFATVARLQRAARRSERATGRAVRAETKATIDRERAALLTEEIEQQASMDDLARDAVVRFIDRAQWEARAELAAALQYPDLLTQLGSGRVSSVEVADRRRHTGAGS